MRVRIPSKTIVVATLFVTLEAGAIALAASNTTVTAHKTAKGRILANSKGFSLYAFSSDKQGRNGKPAKTTCYQTCAKAWPPLLVGRGGKTAAARGAGVNQKLLGTTRRSDGSLQVTYNGWPLYGYRPDTKPGQIKGEGARQFGAAWHLVNLKGRIVKTGCPPGFIMTSTGCLSSGY